VRRWAWAVLVAGSGPTAMEDGIDQQVTRDSDTASDGSRDAEAMEGEQDGGESANGVIVASAADLAVSAENRPEDRRWSSREDVSTRHSGGAAAQIVLGICLGHCVWWTTDCAT
jgi:hypothetical protein